MAYFLVHSLALASYLSLSVLYSLAMSGTNGSSGFGSVNNELKESSTLLVDNAGDHYLSKMSKQIDPLELIFG